MYTKPSKNILQRCGWLIIVCTGINKWIRQGMCSVFCPCAGSLLYSGRQIGRDYEGLRNVEQLTYAKTSVKLVNKLTHGYFATLLGYNCCPWKLLPPDCGSSGADCSPDWTPLWSLPTWRPTHNRALLTHPSCRAPPPQLLSGGMC